jgi:uncharacterized protein (DUF2384 family)
LIVEISIPLLKVAVMFALMETPEAASTGTVEATVGLVVSAVVLVVNLHTELALKALPAMSLAPEVMVAAYTVLAAR